MAINLAMVTIDCTAPGKLASWWSDLLDGEINTLQADEFVLVALPQGPTLGFQKVPDPTPGKNKVHLDFHSEDKEAEVARFVAAGAMETGRNSFGDFGWVVLADPEGNAFCIG